MANVPFFSFAESLSANPFGENKAPCISCGEEWYVIHHTEGVCSTCREKGVLCPSTVSSLFSLWVGTFLLSVLLVALMVFLTIYSVLNIDISIMVGFVVLLLIGIRHGLVGGKIMERDERKKPKGFEQIYGIQ